MAPSRGRTPTSSTSRPTGSGCSTTAARTAPASCARAARSRWRGAHPAASGCGTGTRSSWGWRGWCSCWSGRDPGRPARRRVARAARSAAAKQVIASFASRAGRGDEPGESGARGIVAVKYRDYYEVLGVPRKATAQEIKRAYRQLARKHHPDLQPAAERANAGERVKEINEAYEVLSHPEKRAKYDALGSDWKSGMDFTPPPGAGWGPAGPGRGSTGADQWEDFGAFSDFFASLFGGSPGDARRSGVRIKLPGSDVEAELPVTLEEVLHGGRRRITLGGGRTLDVEIPRGVRDGTVLRLAG